jgi:acyl dehydratase
MNVNEDPRIKAFFAPDRVQICQSEAPVSEWSIRAWCRAMGDKNPVYQDPEAAVRHGHGGVFAPPVMMHAFTLPGLIDESRDNMQLAFRRTLASLGVNSVVAVNYDHEYSTPIRLGDRLTREVRLTGMSEPKDTALGLGYFVTMTDRISNQRDETIGVQHIRSLFFSPGEKKRLPASKPAPVGEGGARIELPSLVIPVTTTLVVATAIATNDYEKVHHDRDLAQSQGLKDIIMNILTSSGLAIRLVTDWAGPATKIKRLATRLHTQNYPGDTMTLTGWTDRAAAPGQESVVHVRGTNARGPHIECQITIA